MGTILGAYCPCGYESKDIFAGGGFKDFMTSLRAPAYCPHCHRLVEADYMKKDARCGRCRKRLVFYNDPSLRTPEKAGVDPHTVFRWDMDEKGVSFVLPDTLYLCPKCGKMTMEFCETGCWD